jgi:hypothetical protein
MQPLVYVDTSEVREGALGQLREAIGTLAAVVEQNEPQLVSYGVYFSDDGRRMTVVHVHADSASLDHHMEVAGPRFAASADLLRLLSIHIYGDPSEKALGQLRDKVRLLGSGDVVVHRPQAGFARVGSPSGGRPLSADTVQRRRRRSGRGGRAASLIATIAVWVRLD